MNSINTKSWWETLGRTASLLSMHSRASGPAALRSLLKAEQAHDIYVQHLKTDPLLDPIRNDAQFKTFLAQLKFPP